MINLTNKEESNIHPSAVISPSAKIGKNVTIGPYTVIGDEVEIGDGSNIGPNAVIAKWTTIGKDCRIFQFASVGEIPQDLKFKKPIVPGDSLITKAEIVKVRGDFGVLHADGYVDEKLVASADFKFALKHSEGIKA